MDSTAVVLESQPDWLTAATHHRDNSNRLALLAHSLSEQEQAAGARRRPWRLMGYVGWQAGRVRFGDRGSAAIVQLSGDLAAQHLTTVRTLQDSLTRLDLATTVRLPAPDDALASRDYDRALALRAVQPRLSVPRLVQDGDGGSTLYIGERTSNYLLRVYNKEAERRAAQDSDGAARYAGCWRYELEVKGGPAPLLARLVDESQDSAGYIQAFIHDHATAHGLLPAFPHSGAQALRPGFHRRSDRERTLDWFRRSVAPAIRRLTEQGGALDVTAALGLNDPPARSDRAP